VWILWGSKIAISHWQSQSPLTQGWRYRTARDKCSWNLHLPTVFLAHPTRDIHRLSSGIWCGGSGWQFPRLSSRGRLAMALPRSRSSCSPLPKLFCGVSVFPPPAMSIDRRGPCIGGEQRRGPATAGDCPPSLRALASDPTPIMLVKGTYSG